MDDDKEGGDDKGFSSILCRFCIDTVLADMIFAEQRKVHHSKVVEEAALDIKVVVAFQVQKIAKGATFALGAVIPA